MTPIRTLLVDPSLFTAPYDAALSRGLAANAVEPMWATRQLRADEEEDLPATIVSPIFYPLTDGPRRDRGRRLRWLKGVEHLAGLRRTGRIAREGFDIVHFQWAVLPRLDAASITAMRSHVPVVLTVHDTTPFNGKAVSWMQHSGHDAVMRAVDAVIVHTDGARDALRARGLEADRIRVVPHGPLPLHGAAKVETRRMGRWRIVMFGRLQHYKGIDILIEAAGLIDEALRNRLDIVVAGEPMIDLAPLRARAAALGLEDVIEFRPARLDEDAMAALLQSADAFVFPYRAIEASGVLYLVSDLGKWMIASDLGAFRDRIRCGETGTLVPPSNPVALAAALNDSIGRVPVAPPSGMVDWQEIGAMTRSLYEELVSSRKQAA